MHGPMVFPWLFIAPTWATDPSVDPDVSVRRVVAVDRAILAERLRSTRHWERLLGACTKDWEHGPADEGPAEVTYRVMSFRRRLQARVVERDPQHVIELDHAGPKGFVTRVLLEPEPGGSTAVTLITYLNPPGWPFRSYYFDTVKPAWEACYEQALDALEHP